MGELPTLLIPPPDNGIIDVSQQCEIYCRSQHTIYDFIEAFIFRATILG
jgi:hypothetical protein